MHFFSPVTVYGAPQCCDKGKATYTIGRPWRTTSQVHGMAALYPDDAADNWQLVDTIPLAYGNDVPGTYSGSFEFGVICIRSVKFKFTTDIDKESDTITIIISVNGAQAAKMILVDSSVYTGTTDTVSTFLPGGQVNFMTVNLTSDQMLRPCGNVISVSVDQVATGSGAGGGVSTYCKIADVT